MDVTLRYTAPAVTIRLTAKEVSDLLDEYDKRGSEDHILNHCYCSDPNCVSCFIVKRIRDYMGARK